MKKVRMLLMLAVILVLSACGGGDSTAEDRGNPIDNAIGFLVTEEYQKAVQAGERSEAQFQYYIAWSEEFYHAAGNLYDASDEAGKEALVKEVKEVEAAVAAAEPVPTVQGVQEEKKEMDTEQYRLEEAKAYIYRTATLSLIKRIGDSYLYYYEGCPDLYVWSKPRNIPAAFALA